MSKALEIIDAEIAALRERVAAMDAPQQDAELERVIGEWGRLRERLGAAAANEAAIDGEAIEIVAEILGLNRSFVEHVVWGFERARARLAHQSVSSTTTSPAPAARDEPTIWFLDYVRQDLDDIGIPRSFFSMLHFAPDDWTFVVKAHALVEAVAASRLVRAFGARSALVFERMQARELFVASRAVGTLSPEAVAFAQKLSALRNGLVHDARNVGFRFKAPGALTPKVTATIASACHYVRTSRTSEPRALTQQFLDYTRNDPYHLLWIVVGLIINETPPAVSGGSGSETPGAPA